MNGLSKKLKERREQKELTQMDIAKALGYSSPQFVSNWECGKCHPAPHQFPQLAKMLGVSVNWLTDEYIQEINFRIRAKINDAVYRSRRKR